jgi:hypothetical protein
MSLATPTPTPVAMAQLSASVQVALRSAGTGGGVLPRAALHTFSRTRWVMSPDRAPDPSVITFQLYVFRATMVSLIPRLVPP